MTIANSRSDRCQTCHRRIRRNAQQNALLWALYARMAEREWNGERYSADTFHTYYKARLLGCEDVKMPNGKTLSIPRSTADLSVDEFADYFDAVQADAALRGVYLEDAPA